MTVVLDRDMVLRLGARPGLGACDYDARATAQCACAKELSGSLSRQESPCCDIVPKQAGWFGSRDMPSLPRQRFWVLCRDKVSLALCRDRVS